MLPTSLLCSLGQCEQDIGITDVACPTCILRRLPCYLNASMDIDTRTALVNALVYAPFSTALPLPFRVVLLGGLGILAWAVNLHLLHLLGIDTAFALDFRIHDKGRPQLAHPSTLYGPIYRIFFAYAAWAFTGWVVFRVACAGNMDSMDDFKIIAVVTLSGIIFGVLMPFNAVSLRERRAFCSCVLPQRDSSC